MAKLDDSMAEQLDAVLNAADFARPPLIGTARATMQAFGAHLAADTVMAALDGNPIRPETAIAGPLTAKLKDVQAAFL